MLATKLNYYERKKNIFKEFPRENLESLMENSEGIYPDDADMFTESIVGTCNKIIEDLQKQIKELYEGEK